MVHVSFIYILHLLAGTATTIEPIRSRNSEHFLRGLSAASTRIVVRTARPPVRAASALWIDECGAQQATGFNSVSARSAEGSLFRECSAPALVLVRCVPHGAFSPAMT